MVIRSRTVLNVVCASTRQWNPGDEWIARGVRRLFRQALPNSHLNWILYDRNPDLYCLPWEKEARRGGLLSNSYQAESSFDADVAVVAGTPEWSGPHLQALFRACSECPRWMFIGIGGGGPQTLNELELSILRRAFITTRDEAARLFLGCYGIQARLMPCPSLCSAPYEAPTRKLSSVGLVIQSDRVINQSIEPALKAEMFSLLEQLQKHYEVAVICNYLDEFLEYAERLATPVWYSWDSEEYFDLLAHVDCVISTRLHSAFVANSILKPAILLNQSPRAVGAAGAWRHTKVHSCDEVLGALRQFDCDRDLRLLLNDKRELERDYVAAIAQFLYPPEASPGM